MKDSIVVYFSRRDENHYDGGLKVLEVGNTECVAGMIAEAVGCESFRVERAEPYPAGYRDCCAQAVAEWKARARPEIKDFRDAVMEAEVIFVGYPIWCGTMPMPMYTFLEHYDFSGKVIAPFCTHEGSGFGTSLQELQRVCPDAVIAPGFEVKGCLVGKCLDDVIPWAKKLAEEEIVSG